VFGSPDFGGETLRLDDLGTGGFTLRGFEAQGAIGRAVSAAGDVNDDGFGDLLICALGMHDGNLIGKTYVVFGGDSLAGTTITPDNLGAGGFTLIGRSPGAVDAVAAAGDFNGDGIDDVIIGDGGATHFPGGVFSGFGEAYVVFGGTNFGGTTRLLNDLGEGGFTMLGIDTGMAGGHVAGAGDVNEDGFADVIVGIGNLASSIWNKPGDAYVVFGGNDRAGASVTLTALGSAGFSIHGFQNEGWA
jgi:hypothetical protein